VISKLDATKVRVSWSNALLSERNAEALTFRIDLGLPGWGAWMQTGGRDAVIDLGGIAPGTYPAAVGFMRDGVLTRTVSGTITIASSTSSTTAPNPVGFAITSVVAAPIDDSVSQGPKTRVIVEWDPSSTPADRFLIETTVPEWNGSVQAGTGVSLFMPPLTTNGYQIRITPLTASGPQPSVTVDIASPLGAPLRRFASGPAVGTGYRVQVSAPPRGGPCVAYDVTPNGTLAERYEVLSRNGIYHFVNSPDWGLRITIGSLGVTKPVEPEQWMLIRQLNSGRQSPWEVLDLTRRCDRPEVVQLTSIVVDHELNTLSATSNVDGNPEFTYALQATNEISRNGSRYSRYGQPAEFSPTGSFSNLQDGYEYNIVLVDNVDPNRGAIAQIVSVTLDAPVMIAQGYSVSPSLMTIQLLAPDRLTPWGFRDGFRPMGAAPDFIDLVMVRSDGATFNEMIDARTVRSTTDLSMFTLSLPRPAGTYRVSLSVRNRYGSTEPVVFENVVVP
jgi:hypothetical protein